MTKKGKRNGDQISKMYKKDGIQFSYSRFACREIAAGQLEAYNVEHEYKS